jgi:phospholipid/cholesterol/gamma-HCH transport system permease protein
MEIELITEQGGAGQILVRPVGHVDIQTSRQLYDTLGRLRGDEEVQWVTLDFSRVNRLDSAGIATVSVVANDFQGTGKRFVVQNLSEEQRRAFNLMPAKSTEPPEIPEQSGFLESVGDYGVETLEAGSKLYDTFTDAVFSVLRMAKGQFPPKGSVTEQSVKIGVDALPIIGLLSFLLGLILAFQSAYQLRQFGANIYVANLVAISMVREFGPMMTAIILAGRSGSAMAAELGTMKVQEEVDALRTMSISPTRYLILPRMIGITIVQPALTVMANIVGIFGGLLIATSYLDLASIVYINKSIEALQLGDLLHGLLKSFCFAWIIGVISCYSGMSVQKGAKAVGEATTKAVVASIFTIIVADSAFTTFVTITA